MTASYASYQLGMVRRVTIETEHDTLIIVDAIVSIEVSEERQSHYILREGVRTRTSQTVMSEEKHIEIKAGLPPGGYAEVEEKLTRLIRED